MAHQKISITPNPPPKDEIRDLIETVENQYHKQLAQCNRLRRDCWAKTQDMDALARHSNLFLLQVHTSYNAVFYTEKSLEVENKPIPNNLLLLKIKLMILMARIDTIRSELFPEKIADALKTYSDITKELNKYSKTLNVKNSPIQKELGYALRIISIYGDDGQIENYNASLWVGVQWNLVRHFKNGFDKLESYRANIDFTGNTRSLFLADKRDFYSIFEAMDKECGLAFKNNELKTGEKLDYLKACYLVYKSTIQNHPTIKKAIPTNATSNKIYTIRDLTDLCNVWQKESEIYLPKLNALRKVLTTEELLENIDSMEDFQFQMPAFYDFINKQLLDLLKVYNCLGSTTNETLLKDRVFDTIVKIRSFFIEFHQANCKLDGGIQEQLDFYFFKTQTKNKHSDTYVNTKFLDEKEFAAFIKNYKEPQKKDTPNTESKINNNQTPESAPTPTKKHHKKPRKKNNQASIPQTQQTKTLPKEKKEINPEPKARSISESQTPLEQAYEEIDKKHYEEAIRLFEQARKEALTIKDRLLAIDGLISAIQKEVLKSLNKINPEYDYQPNNIIKTKETHSTQTKNLSYLDSLYSEHDQLTSSLDETSLKKDIVLGNNLLREEYLKITAQLTDITKRLHDNTKKKEPKHTIKTKPDAIIIVQNQFPPLQQTIKPQSTCPIKEKTIPLSRELKEVFDFLNQVPGSKNYLVGSMVLHLIQIGWMHTKIKPSDLDFLSLDSKSEDWIKDGNFSQNTNEKHLFKFTGWGCEFKPYLPLELWLADENKTLINCLLARDFTIAALACDKDGNVIDPTGLGFEDVKNKILRMIGNPKNRIQQSPSILLRVIKYMMLGFKPDKAIFDAMHTWRANKETN